MCARWQAGIDRRWLSTRAKKYLCQGVLESSFLFSATERVLGHRLHILEDIQPANKRINSLTGKTPWLQKCYDFAAIRLGR
jgi:hypothetical protein